MNNRQTVQSRKRDTMTVCLAGCFARTKIFCPGKVWPAARVEDIGTRSRRDKQLVYHTTVLRKVCFQTGSG